MSQPKLTIRPPPHVDFVQFYPGVSPNHKLNRPPAHLAGTVELRPGPKGIKVSWVKIELKKIEVVNVDDGNSGRLQELIGRNPTTLWQRSDPVEWELMFNKDWQFTIPLPEGLPPSVQLDNKGSGIFYELVASMSMKGKRSFLSKKPVKQAPIVVSVRINLEKHDLHCAWPIYRPLQPETRTALYTDEGGGVYMTIERKFTCYGPGDSVWVRVRLVSQRIGTVKVKRTEMWVNEIITLRPTAPPGSGPGVAPPNASQKTLVLCSQKIVPPNPTIYKQEPFVLDIKGVIPLTHHRVTVKTGKLITVNYELGVKSIVELPNGKERELVVDHMYTTIAGWGFKEGARLIEEKIGWDEKLCEGRDLWDVGNLGGRGRSGSGNQEDFEVGGDYLKAARYPGDPEEGASSNGNHNPSPKSVSTNGISNVRRSTPDSSTNNRNSMLQPTSSQAISPISQATHLSSASPDVPVPIGEFGHLSQPLGGGGDVVGYRQSTVVTGSSNVNGSLGATGFGGLTGSLNGAIGGGSVNRVTSRSSVQRSLREAKARLGYGDMDSVSNGNGAGGLAETLVEERFDEEGREGLEERVTELGTVGNESGGYKQNFGQNQMMNSNPILNLTPITHVSSIRKNQFFVTNPTPSSEIPAVPSEKSRFTIANPDRTFSTSPNSQTPQEYTHKAAWETAEEEKRRLKEKDREQTRRDTEGGNREVGLARASTSKRTLDSVGGEAAAVSNGPMPPMPDLPPATGAGGGYLTAEEEKRMLAERTRREREEEEERERQQRAQTKPNSSTTYPTAEDEKRKLYQEAKLRTAEEEKRKMFEDARREEQERERKEREENQEWERSEIVGVGMPGMGMVEKGKGKAEYLSAAPYPVAPYPGQIGYNQLTPLTTSSSSPQLVGEKAQLAAYYQAKQEAKQFNNLSTAPMTAPPMPPMTLLPATPYPHFPPVRSQTFAASGSFATPSKENSFYSASVRTASAYGEGNLAQQMSEERRRYMEAIRMRDQVHQSVGSTFSTPDLGSSSASFVTAEEEKSRLGRSYSTTATPMTLSSIDRTSMDYETLPAYGPPPTLHVPITNSPPLVYGSEDKPEARAYYEAREMTEEFSGRLEARSIPVSPPPPIHSPPSPINVGGGSEKAEAEAYFAAKDAANRFNYGEQNILNGPTISQLSLNNKEHGESAPRRRESMSSKPESDGSLIMERDPAISKGKRPARSTDQSPILEAAEFSQPPSPPPLPFSPSSQPLSVTQETPGGLSHAPYPSTNGMNGSSSQSYYGYIPPHPVMPAFGWTQAPQNNGFSYGVGYPQNPTGFYGAPPMISPVQQPREFDETRQVANGAPPRPPKIAL